MSSTKRCGDWNVPKFGVNGRLLGLRLVYMYSIYIYLIYYII